MSDITREQAESILGDMIVDGVLQRCRRPTRNPDTGFKNKVSVLHLSNLPFSQEKIEAVAWWLEQDLPIKVTPNRVDGRIEGMT